MGRGETVCFAVTVYRQVQIANADEHLRQSREIRSVGLAGRKRAKVALAHVVNEEWEERAIALLADLRGLPLQHDAIGTAASAWGGTFDREGSRRPFRLLD